MKAPDKIYVHEISAEELTESLPYHVCYLRKDFVAEMLDTVENHAFLDGREKLKEELLEWAKEQKTLMELGGHISIDDVIDKIESL